MSGGADSVALLSLLRTRGDLKLVVAHLDHETRAGASAADAAFVRDLCAAWDIPFVTTTFSAIEPSLPVTVNNLSARWRAARIALFRQVVSTHNLRGVILAHHADDQAETVLLQLLRGAGPAGLAAMPRHRPGDVGGPALLRPLLDLPRAALAAYASARGLAWIDDESNADRRHKRNLLRLDVAPLLAKGFPGYPSVLVRTAAHQAEASALLDELACQDAGDTQDGLDRATLTAASPARARNLLRWFLRREGLRPPSAARLAGMLAQLRTAGTDARTRILHDGAEIGCHRGRIVVHAPAVGAYARGWGGESSVDLPGGILRFERTRGDGIAAAKFEAAAVVLRSRRGGERIQLAANRPRRAVKKLLYDAQLPIWRREALPFIWCGEELAAVPGIGIALSFQAQSDEDAWRVDWRPK